jgi:phosphoglycerate-specific signal transduction histidine kinase
MSKSTFLVTDDNPTGWKIEDILTEIQNDIVRRSQKIVDDARPEARTVLNNNFEILGLLSQCIEKATDSTRLLNRAFGPHKDGEPRIGVA